MNAFVYAAALYCEDCGNKILADFAKRAVGYEDDSDCYPQGPYAEGGGEADCPQNCDDCGTFLENPLTDEGYSDVKERIEQHVHDPTKGREDVLKEWADFYDLEWPESGGHFDRFDVCYAYLAYMTNWHSGQNSKEYALSGVFYRIGYSPGHGFTQDPWEMEENVRAIYWGLVSGETKLRDRRN